MDKNKKKVFKCIGFSGVGILSAIVLIVIIIELTTKYGPKDDKGEKKNLLKMLLKNC